MEKLMQLLNSLPEEKAFRAIEKSSFKKEALGEGLEEIDKFSKESGETFYFDPKLNQGCRFHNDHLIVPLTTDRKQQIKGTMLSACKTEEEIISRHFELMG